MASVSATSLKLFPSTSQIFFPDKTAEHYARIKKSALAMNYNYLNKKLDKDTKGCWRGSSLRAVSVRWAKTSFPSLRTSRLRISCAAKPETFDRVCQIVRNQLALPPESELTPETKFAALGADSLDTVEIVMSLEEEFDISVEEESADNITTVQEAADLIEKLVQKKAA